VTSKFPKLTQKDFEILVNKYVKNNSYQAVKDAVMKKYTELKNGRSMDIPDMPEIVIQSNGEPNIKRWRNKQNVVRPSFNNSDNSSIIEVLSSRSSDFHPITVGQLSGIKSNEDVFGMYLVYNPNYSLGLSVDEVAHVAKQLPFFKHYHKYNKENATTERTKNIIRNCIPDNIRVTDEIIDYVYNITYFELAQVFKAQTLPELLQFVNTLGNWGPRLSALIADYHTKYLKNNKYDEYLRVFNKFKNMWTTVASEEVEI
jgi:hypothetical protein